jgi:glutamine amidotransferase
LKLLGFIVSHYFVNGESKMCRLFGFRSVIQSQVHRSLVDAENALEVQANDHPDGWGVAYYETKIPHVIKSEGTALNCRIFEKISGVVSSETVVAHVRTSTVGNNNILNTHPFQYGRWVFAHNGNIRDFDKLRPRLMALVAPNMRRFVFGETDSEFLFYFLLSRLANQISLSSENVPVLDVMKSLRNSIKELTEVIGAFESEEHVKENGIFLTFILTNGNTMVAFQGGKNLKLSTYKKRCIDRDHCPCYSAECEEPSQTGFINHLIFSSECLSGENIWGPLEFGQFAGVDQEMKLHKMAF